MSSLTLPRSASFVYVESSEWGQSRLLTMIKSTLPLVAETHNSRTFLLGLPSSNNSFLET